MKKHLSILGLCIVLTACAVQRQAHLYPVAAGKGNGGMLTATFIATGSGHGDITLQMPDEEVLKGEFTTVRNGTMGFGSIFASVYGNKGYASGSGFGTSYSVQGASPGRADAIGPEGTTAQGRHYQP